jgi:type VI secretion system protein ImpE
MTRTVADDPGVSLSHASCATAEGVRASDDDVPDSCTGWLRSGAWMPASRPADQGSADPDMIPTEELFRPGNLSVPHGHAARRPAAGELNMLCARMLMLAGQWDRALQQLEDAASLDARVSLIAHTYRGLIYGERVRAAVFAGHSSPAMIGGAKPWLAQLVSCLSLERQGQTAWATELRLDAFEVAPEVCGSINGSVFTAIADADSRLGPVLEVIVGGAYYWAPFACIQHITIQRPGDAHDLVWLPAQFTWRSGEQATGFIPARYPGSEHNDDGDIRLGQKTHWRPVGEDCYVGLGQRRLRTGTEQIGIVDVRDVRIAAGANVSHAPLGVAS